MKRIVLRFVTLTVLILGCGMPVAPGPKPTRTPQPTFTPGVPIDTLVPIPTNTPFVSLPAGPPPPYVPTSSPISQPEAIVAAGALNVRFGPGVNYDKITQVKEGDKLKIVGRTEAGDWLKIVTSDGKEGWVAAEFVTVNADLGQVSIAQAPPAPQPLPATPLPIAIPQPISTPKPPFQYSVTTSSKCWPNCGTSGAKGKVGNVNGLFVRVWTEGFDGLWSNPTQDGRWEVSFGPGARGGHWYMAVYSADKTKQLSEVFEFDTDWEPCAPASNGCQWKEVDFSANW